jgi:medium-chain acyl-[acyl-carrier-protein] hydrolase
MDYSRDYLVHYYEADSSRRLTLPTLVQYFEDIAILHSSSKGLDLAYYDANRCGWMLLKWDIEIHRLPEFGDTVTIGTRVNAIRKFLADRRFVMTAADGSVLAEGRSNWLLVDTERRRPMRVPEQQFECFSVPAESESAFAPIDDVISPDAENVDLSAAFSVRAGYRDIDTNRHVNNVSYVGWALDSLPHDFFAGRVPAAFRAQYRKELAAGCEAGVVSLIDGTVTRHSVRSGADELCSIEIGWKQ